MNTEEWNIVKKKLERLYDPVKLDCDGYELTLVLVRNGQFKNEIQIYVNGFFKGKWMLEDCEERRRFFRESTRSLLTNKQRAELKKAKIGKKKMAEFEERAKYVVHDPIWKSFNSLKRHLIKNNKEIKLIS